MKRITTFVLSIIFTTTILTVCGNNEEGGKLSEKELVVGVTGWPHELIFKDLKDLAAEDGLDIEIVVFSDYIMPNTALAEGELDVNSYQHKPFMDDFNTDHDTDLVAVFPTVLSAIGVYSNHVTDINETPEGAKIGISNDPSNSARALILFEDAGIIELDEENRDTATPLDIITNDREVEFIELDAAQLPTMLDEVDLAVINGNFATAHGLDATSDFLFTEAVDSP